MNLSVMEYDIQDQVARITMNHPPVNALGPQFLDDFRQILDEFGKAPPARSLVLTSACPGFFSAGDDVSKLQEIDDDMIALLPEVHALFNAIEALPVPTIAAINGHALGGGLELALACDFRFMAEDSGRIGLPEVRLGLIPAFGGTQRLPLMVGRSKAVQMIFKGLQLSPDEAKAVNLIHDVFPADALLEKAMDYARRLAKQATGAIAAVKACLNAGHHGGFTAGLAMEVEQFNKNIRSHDAREGVTAFLDGRKPEFKGK